MVTIVILRWTESGPSGASYGSRIAVSRLRRQIAAGDRRTARRDLFSSNHFRSAAKF
jgi:hypothetical protein